MELKVSSQQPGGLSPSDCVSDPEEKEFSDDDDDDRNHKHRRRETRSQSLEMDATEQVFSKPYRKHNKPFENGHLFRGTGSQSNEGWKNNIVPLERESFSKFDKRHGGLSVSTRVHGEFNPRIRMNQPFPGNSGVGRGRGRDSWNSRDPRFSSVDPSSQVVHHGSIPPNLFSGRGLPSVSNAQGAPWNAYGLIPAVPNGGLDTLHSLNMQTGLRPSVNPSLNIGIPRQRCRDFEERGFCLRGDMCPMEHGVNRIVVEDVQSLSQFNLPVSLSAAHSLGTTAGPGSLLSANPPLSSSRIHNKSSKPGMADNGFATNGAFSGSSPGGGDFYDPDQPLWSSDGPESSNALLELHSSRNIESESLLDGNPSSRLSGGLCDDPDSEHLFRSTEGGVGSQSMSVWGRMRNTKNRLAIKGKINSITETSDHNNQDTREDPEAVTSIQGTSHQGKRIISEGFGIKSEDTSSFPQNNGLRNTRKPSQRAQRSLFVSGIPLKNNRKEVLLSHFRKFGQVIDIHIPVNTQRAFVQYSKREEAEAALKAPDAVMGNRFIKLFWANRDSIPDDGTNNGNSGSIAPHSTTTASVPSHPSTSDKGKDNLQFSSGSISSASDAPAPAVDQSKPDFSNDPKVPPPNPKKLENLELLKEELRKKQEMLDQKRNEFKRQLDKLAKQKNETATEPAMKRQKVGALSDVAKVVIPSSGELGSAVASPKVDMVADKNKSVEKVLSHGSNTVLPLVAKDPMSLKQPIHPSTPGGSSLPINRFKLDNRPNAFRLIPPLPAGLADVAILKEHFSQYGDISSVELEDLETRGSNEGADAACGARVTFLTRRAAENAFSKGKCWKDHNLQFTWLAAKGSNNERKDKENSPSTIRNHEKAHVASNNSQEAAASKNEGSEISERSSINVNVDDSDSREAVVSKNEASEDSERRNGGIEQKIPDIDLNLNSTQALDEEESPKHGVR